MVAAVENDHLVDPTPVELRPLQRSEPDESEEIAQEHTATVESLNKAVDALTSDQVGESEPSTPEQSGIGLAGSDDSDRPDDEFDRSETDPAAGDPSSATYPPY